LGALRLNVNKHNIKAIGAYRKSGYETVESVVADIGGGYVMDDYVMAKKL
jgi:ribosomal protein S18 acetylase RimI-like enzyme